MQLGYGLFATKEVSAVELILVLILCIILGFTLAVFAITKLVEQLKSNGSAQPKFGNGFQVSFSLVPINNKKSEDSMQVPPPQNNDLD